jgi:hypothetical protein
MFSNNNPNILPSWEKPAKMDEDGDEPPEFYVAGLFSKDKMRVDEMLSRTMKLNDAVPNFFDSETCEFIIRKGLKDWRNFKNADGTELMFDYSNPAKNINRLDESGILWIAAEIWSKTTLSEKKSAS